MSTQPKTFLTPEEYLEIERQAEYKSEYLAGEMFAMAEGTDPHSLIAMNINSNLHQQTRNRQCWTYGSDMRVQVRATGLYTYPDGSAVCGDRKFLDGRRDTLLNPSFILEVLSPSTEAYNRGRKFEHYQTIEPLAEYLLVASDRMHADLFTRGPDGLWLLRSTGNSSDVLELPSIGCRLVLADIYEKVEF
jgi:Uma2 family endonuclease